MRMRLSAERRSRAPAAARIAEDSPVNDPWTTDYDDEDLTFFMLVYRDYELADRCLTDLRAHYPRARVVARSDGDSDPRYDALAARHGAEYLREPRLFTIENGGAVVQRMLDVFEERPTRYLFKIDPDTVVQRRFRFLPTRDGLFGTLQGRPECRSIQGGCMGFSAGAAAALARSGLLRDPRLARPSEFRHEGSHWEKMARRADVSGLSSFDWGLGWAATTLGVAMFDFPEVRSQWKVPVEDPELRYAVVHPRAAGPE
jgi:hypothetical protein